MHKLYIIIGFILSLFFSISIVQSSSANSANIVISQIQLGDSASAVNEYVEIYNNSDSNVEITDWCLYYASASSVQNGSKMVCFALDNANLHIFIPAHSSAFAISNQLANATPSLGSDFKFSATLSGTAGHVRLIDNTGVEIDKVGWGATAVSAEGISTVVPSVGKILQRKTLSADILQDTDINKDDFDTSLPPVAHTYGLIYETQDLCSNIDGIQTVLPNGYLFDENNDCHADVCLNIDGLQQILPDNMELDLNNNCIAHDECLNIPDIQAEVPDGYVVMDDKSCKANLFYLQITELLPNAVGSDEGTEFIEIFNPNDVGVYLTNYVLCVDSCANHSYSFPNGSYIEAGRYLAFYNNEIRYTLVNTASYIQLLGFEGTLIDQSWAYDSPKDGMAWALVNGTWQYTNQPTPGSLNMANYIESNNNEVLVNNFEPCPAGQYRNPETNRCKLIVTTTASSTLVPCKDGQYRSEETNRCRNIASDVTALIPCAEGQERNPETNRCRSVTAAVLGASDLVPCKEGQERNPETNRCRNIVSSMPVAEYAPEQTNESSNNYIGWWALAGVGVVAIIYGVWEWRQEVVNLMRKLGSFIHSSK